MNENLKDILSHLNSEVDQQTLLLYLQGKLSAEKQHDLEKELLDNEFENEALEGLEQFGNKEQIGAVVQQLNLELKKKTDRKKLPQKRELINTQTLVLSAIIFVILIAIVAYFIIHRLQH